MCVAAQYVHLCSLQMKVGICLLRYKDMLINASVTQAAYLHLCEAAPKQHPAGLQAGKVVTGQVIILVLC